MPTGYTAGIYDGSITSFEEYALQCARAFGACITLRDEELTSDIPEFKPSDYHLKKIREIENERITLENTLDALLQLQLDKEHEDRVSSYHNWEKENRLRFERYEAMLVKARAYKAPTSEHVEYAKFLVSQIEDSMKFDCFAYSDLPPVKPSLEEWKANKIRNLYKDLAYHSKEYDAELERVEKRNLWIKALKESLTPPITPSEAQEG